MKKVKLVILVLITLTLISFSVKKYRPYKGFHLKKFEKDLILIQGGTFHYGANDQDRLFSHAPRKTKPTSISTFYMCSHEVSNGEYLEFINSINEKDSILYRELLPDTTVWLETFHYGDPYMAMYFRHPAYCNHPVVGITHKQAKAYCYWLTEKYNKEAKRKVRNAVFKLPTVHQWAYAANGGSGYSQFPWVGGNLQDNKGEWMANFTIIPQQHIQRTSAPSIYDSVLLENKIKMAVKEWPHPSGYFGRWFTTPVISYCPNPYGLYNMAGNVEEFVSEKGITKGGSWKDTGYYLQNFVEETHDTTNSSSGERGFRFVMEIKK